MIHYSKPMQNEARYMRAMTKQKLRQYLKEEEKQHRVTHFRRGHFRHLNSDYYKNKKGQVVFIHAALIKGTAAKTVIG